VKIVVPKEYHSGKTRVPLIPADVKALVEKGKDVEIESGKGVPELIEKLRYDDLSI
jgi:alanine dehydrogenase